VLNHVHQSTTVTDISVMILPTNVLCVTILVLLVLEDNTITVPVVILMLSYITLNVK